MKNYFTKTLKSREIFPALEKKPPEHLLKQFNHQSIKKIQKHFNGKEIFAIRQFRQDDVIRIIKELSKNKAFNFKNIPVNPFVPNAHFLYPLKTSENLTNF